MPIIVFLLPGAKALGGAIGNSSSPPFSISLPTTTAKAASALPVFDVVSSPIKSRCNGSSQWSDAIGPIAERAEVFIVTREDVLSRGNAFAAEESMPVAASTSPKTVLLSMLPLIRSAIPVPGSPKLPTAGLTGAKTWEMVFVSSETTPEEGRPAESLSGTLGTIFMFLMSVLFSTK